MQDILGSVRRSLVFRGPDGEEGDGGGGGISEKINSCLRKSRVGFSGILSKPSPSPPKENVPPIQWRKGELIGCGAFGSVYMGMNLDSGELLAVKQVLIATKSASKDKAQAHVQELEEEVKLLKNLSHPNIVRYLGTAREESTLNILLEFVPGGSISSLLGKFGSFPETVVRMYTKQLLQGLEYLHGNGIMHRDIKGANILVDNKGCIKLADFGASKQVVELATVSGAKSMKGTPYWMAPEVILRTGHDFSADIWSVGCTVIEMATGKPPWSEQYQEVAAMFYVGTTKSHPPIPEHLSLEASDFLLKCLHKDPKLRPAASDLLQGAEKDAAAWDCNSQLIFGEHPFVSAGYQDAPPVCVSSAMQSSLSPTPGSYLNMNMEDDPDIGNWIDPMMEESVMPDMELMFHDIAESFNPISEPSDDWPCKFSIDTEQRGMDLKDSCELVNGADCSPGASLKVENDFTFPCEPPEHEEEDEVMEIKIRAFLNEKALDLKKLQTPLYEEFYNTLNGTVPLSVGGNTSHDISVKRLKLPPKSRSPSRVTSATANAPVDAVNTTSPGSCGRHILRSSNVNSQNLEAIPSPQRDDWKGHLVDSSHETNIPSASCNERHRRWKQELDQELERTRDMIRQAGGGKTSSPKDVGISQQRDQLRFASPSGK